MATPFIDPRIMQLQELVMHEKPEKADAIVWLQGNEYDRGKKVLELYRAGYAPQIVITGNNTRMVDDDKVKVDDLALWLQKHGVDQSAVLVDDTSLNTLNQATRVITLALKRGWSKILLVASTHHQLRAFLTFLHQARAQEWAGKIINQPIEIAWDIRPSGRSKTTREAFAEELEKIKKYTGNLVSLEEGLNCFNL